MRELLVHLDGELEARRRPLGPRERRIRARLAVERAVDLDDIEALALPVLRHRIVATFNAQAEGVTVDEIIRRITKSVPRGEAKRAL